MEKRTMETKDLQSQDPGLASAESMRNRRVYTPKVDIVETNDTIELIADMPGVDERSVSITLERGVLTVYGKVDWKEPESHDAVHREYGIGDYQRAFTLSDAIDQDRIEAQVRNGVLRLKLPKGAGAKVRQISVKGG
jgi:HSP20 family molecular chaperone IbpA